MIPQCVALTANDVNYWMFTKSQFLYKILLQSLCVILRYVLFVSDVSLSDHLHKRLQAIVNPWYTSRECWSFVLMKSKLPEWRYWGWSWHHSLFLNLVGLDLHHFSVLFSKDLIEGSAVTAGMKLWRIIQQYSKKGTSCSRLSGAYRIAKRRNS